MKQIARLVFTLYAGICSYLFDVVLMTENLRIYDWLIPACAMISAYFFAPFILKAALAERRFYLKAIVPVFFFCASVILLYGTVLGAHSGWEKHTILSSAWSGFLLFGVFGLATFGLIIIPISFVLIFIFMLIYRKKQRV